MSRTPSHSPTNNGAAVLEPPAAAPILRNSWETPYPYLADLELAQIQPDPANERPGLAAAVDAALLAWDTLDPNDQVLRIKDLGLDGLIGSIQAGGLLERVKVYPAGPGRFVLSSGHRRFFAYRFLAVLSPQWATIPAIVEPAPSAPDLARIAANLCRKDIDAISLARGIAALLAGDPDLTQARVGAMLGKSQSAVANTLRLLDLPERIQALLAAGELRAGHALELLAIREAPLDYWGRPVRTIAEEQVGRAERCARDGGSVASLRQDIAWYNGTQVQCRTHAEQAAADRAAWAATQKATANKAPTPEEQAAAEAERARKEAEAAKEEKAQARRANRLEERAAFATRVIDDAIGWGAGQTVCVEALRLAAVAALEGAARTEYSYRVFGDDVKAAFLKRIQQAPFSDLIDCLTEIGRAALTLDDEQRALHLNAITRWADRKWHLSWQIASTLREHKLIQANSFTSLTDNKPRPPAPGTVPVLCPRCDTPLEPRGTWGHQCAWCNYICDNKGLAGATPAEAAA